MRVAERCLGQLAAHPYDMGVVLTAKPAKLEAQGFQNSFLAIAGRA